MIKREGERGEENLWLSFSETEDSASRRNRSTDNISPALG